MDLRSLLLAAPLLLAACTVGPNYAGPPKSAPVAEQRGAFLRGDSSMRADEPAARWWEALGDPVLTGLVDDALANAPTVAAATARIDQARAQLSATRTAVLPTLSTSFTAPHISLPAGTLGGLGGGNGTGGRTDSQSYSLGFDASWEIDLFGGRRRQAEAAGARVGAAEAALADAQVALSAEVARAYIGLRTRQAAQAAGARIVALDAQRIALAEARLQGGTAPAQPLEALRSEAARDATDLATAGAEATVLRDQLALLTGREPGALDTTLAAPAPIPLPPAEVAVGDPARLLRSRPDVRRAERLLAAANADVGAKIAERFPKISFLGLLGLGGPSIGQVFDPASLIGIALPRISWTLFDGGRAASNVRAARGAFAEAEANYRQAVLAALQDAESSLTRFGAQRVALGNALAAEAAVNRSGALQRQRADAGTARRSDALDAERSGLQAALASASARAELATGFVAVEKALGLGWSPRPA